MTLTPQDIRALPKVVLHDHLDGGVRPETVLELANEAGHPLPADSVAGLADWFYEAADSGSLVRYLETFEHTIAVMQTPENLRRIAREWVLDQAADGVVHGEARWAPEQHLREGLSLEQAVAAVADGLADGMDEAARSGHPMVARQILTSLRHLPPSPALAALTAESGTRYLVCGFDIAGPEDGFPASLHASTLAQLRARWVPLTIHAGEAAGVDSIAGALAEGALRLGHGARLVEDVRATPDGYVLGSVATWVRDRCIPLELSPSSNLQTGIAATMSEHPFGLLHSLGFTVTVNCDNRLMSRTSMSREMELLVDAFGYEREDLLQFTRNAARAAFLHLDEREALLARIDESSRT